MSAAPKARFAPAPSISDLNAARGAARPLQAVMLGCGVVNGGVLERLDTLKGRISLNAVLTRSGKPCGRMGAADLTELQAVLDTGPDLIIEALPDCSEAERAIAWAADHGVDVVSANKAVLARRPDLFDRAARTGARISCSASVGGGVPVLETAERLRAGGAALTEISGVLNGTSNFVIDRIAEGLSREAAIKEAQAAGFAEADPSADLDGLDAAAKLVLIARFAFGETVSAGSIPCDSLRLLEEDSIRAAAGRGERYRQIGNLKRGPDGLEASVRLIALPEDAALARPRLEENLVRFQGEDGLDLIVQGKGAGREPTASAMLSDIASLITDRRETR